MSETARATILVVDDEPEVRKLVCAMASQFGNAVAAANGVCALATYKLFKPIDLLITDVVMEGMSGPALAEQMSTLQPGLKVLYISGYAHSRVVRKYVVEPGYALLTKPFGPGQLEARLRAMLAPATTSTGSVSGGQ